MTATDKILKRNSELSSCLCVGLDTDISKLPKPLSRDIQGMLDFNKGIIESTKEFASAYKINFAFYERYGVKGYDILLETLDYISNDIHVIADAKRGDIGNTSAAYSDSVFIEASFDSITVSPYMGRDSIEPFLREDKLVYVLALTSNPGSSDFQRLISEGKPLYRHVIEKCTEWGGSSQIGYVVGATHPQELAEIRDWIPDRHLLVPGVGKQGGDAGAVLKANNNGPMLVNSSRAILYASSEEDWKEAAHEIARNTAQSLSA